MTGREWLLLATLSTLWGGSFYFVEIALEDLPPFTVVWARVASGAGVLWAALLAMWWWTCAINSRAIRALWPARAVQTTPARWTL